MEFSRQENWTGQPFPSPGHLPNPGIKPDLLHHRQILYHLSHQESPLRGLLSNIYSQFRFFFFFSLIPNQHLQLLGCCKRNCSFCTVEIRLWDWNTFLNKRGYVTHHLMHISCLWFVCFFWLKTYYLLFILYLFSTMEMMLDKKQILAIFLSSKRVAKQRRQCIWPRNC